MYDKTRSLSTKDIQERGTRSRGPIYHLFQKSTKMIGTDQFSTKIKNLAVYLIQFEANRQLFKQKHFTKKICTKL